MEQGLAHDDPEVEAEAAPAPTKRQKVEYDPYAEFREDTLGPALDEYEVEGTEEEHPLDVPKLNVFGRLQTDSEERSPKFLPPKYFQHWMLLVAAIYLLLKEDISSNELDMADAMLRCFVRDLGKLYHNKFYTYNIHNLLHVTLLVKRWGPLWATSAFDFESYNGFITSHVHGTKHLGKELLNNIKIIQSLTVLENSLERLGRPKVKVQLGAAVDVELLPSEKKLLEENCISDYCVYDRIKTDSDIFTSRMYDQHRKRANSLVEFDVNKFGEILHLLRDRASGEILCLISVFKIKHIDIFFLEDSFYQLRHLLPIEDSNLLTLVPVSSIITKVIKAGNYLCLRPNHYEVNL
ncbi:hypothetical protein FOCC_FOCC016463 [Frankliniella occidentalis]|nr:hypothetical protein FOCC_FOCC016463 [Frankliniella occidentalis]